MRKLRWRGTNRRTAVYDAKFLRVGAPGEVVDRALFVESYPAVKVTGSAEKIHSRLAIIALI